MTLLLPCFGSNCTRKARRGKASLLCLLLVMTLLVGMVQPAAADEEYVCEIDGGDQYETLAAALAAVEAGQTKTIRMLKNHDHVGGIIIDDKNVTVELNSFSVNSSNLTSGQTGLTVRNGGTFALNGDGAFNVTGHISGVFATGDGSSATVTNASATSSYGNGAVAMYGGDIVVNGNALGGYNGVSVANSGSTVIVNGNATGTASDSSGARAASGGSVTINGGTAQGVMHGAYANGSENCINSSIMINGGDAIGTGDSYSQGAHAELGGSIHIDGDVQGAEYGVVSSTDSIVAISGSVTVTKEANGVGVDAERGGTIEIGGNVVANGSSLGAFATIEAEITIDGEIQASNYIRIFDDIEEVPVDMDENDGVINPIKPGYYEYSAGTSTVWVKVPATDTTPPVWTAGYPGTSYVSDEDLGLSVSADEVCMVYYVVLANNAQAPTSARVRNGQDGEGNAIPYPGSDSFEYTDPPGIKSHGVLGLAPETAYDIYVVLMDGNDNLQSEPAKIDVTTLQDIDTIPVDAKSGITHQEQGADGSKQVTLTVTVQNAAGDPINGIGPGYFEVSVDGSSVQRFDTSPLFSGFADNGGGTYTVTFTGDADDKEYEFTDLSVFDVVIDSSYTVTTPPADSQIATAGEGWSMGLNNYGQLGIGSFVNKDTPTQIGDETDWASVAAGDSHTLAVKSDGSLWAWGWNSEGQIGDGTDVNKRSPTLISADEDGKWVMVAAGGVHSLALKENGSLWAWGYNVCGQLGVGDFADRNTPTQVGTDTDWVAVTAGMDHSVAVKSDGSLWAWGSGHYGQLGNGIEGSGNWVNAPMKIGQDSDWAAVSAGYRHNVARKEDGTLWTWGDNTSHDTSNRICGQLGGGITAECVTAPTKISAAGEVWQAAAAGKYHTAAIKSDGSLWTWGGNAYGELGIGTIDSNTHANPAQVGEDTDWAAVITGYRHNAAWKTDGSLWFWGHNGTGQLGVATPWSQNSPKKTIGDDRDWIAVATGDAHTVFIKAADGGAPQLPALSGVSITGSAIYGEILTANINYTSQAPEDEPVYQWKRSGVDITGATAATYILGEADIGKTITVAATADGIHATGSAVSTATALVEKADTAPPAMPVLSGKTHNSVTLTANATHEFRVDGGGLASQQCLYRIIAGH